MTPEQSPAVIDRAPVELVRKRLAPNLMELVALKVADRVSYEKKATLLKSCKGWMKELQAKVDAIKDPATEVWKAACAMEKEVMGPWKAAEQQAKTDLINYDESEELRIEVERKKAEALALAEETKRREAEAAALADERAKADAEGDLDAAAAAQEAERELAATPIEAPPVTFFTEAPPKVEGITGTKRASAKINDLKKIVAHILATPYLAYILPRIEEAIQSELNGIVKRQGGAEGLPGVECVWIRGLSSRSM